MAIVLSVSLLILFTENKLKLAQLNEKERRCFKFNYIFLKFLENQLKKDKLMPTLIKVLGCDVLPPRTSYDELADLTAHH